MERRNVLQSDNKQRKKAGAVLMTDARQMLPAPAAVQMFDHQNLFKTYY